MEAKKQENKNVVDIKMALGVILRTVLVSLMCLMVYFGVWVILESISTHEIGYRVYELDANSNPVVVEEVYTEDEDPASTTAPTTAPTGDTTETTQYQYTEKIRSEMPGGIVALREILCQVIMLLLLTAFPYSMLWLQGDKDRNRVNFGRMQPDPWRGVRVGLMAAIPYMVVYLLLLASKLSLFMDSFIHLARFIMTPFLPLYNLVAGPQAVAATADVPWWGIAVLIIPVAALPAICGMAYHLGYKQYSIWEHLTYAKQDKKKS